jgi:ankyrin repeat protein
MTGWKPVPLFDRKGFKLMTAEELGQLIHEGQGADQLPAFLASGGDVNAIDPRSELPLLHLACEHMNFDAIRALAGAGADVNGKDAAGQAALHVAVDIDIDSVIQANGSTMTFETTRLLLSLGADPTISDSQGKTPRDWAENFGPNALEQFDRETG